MRRYSASETSEALSAIAVLHRVLHAIGERLEAGAGFQGEIAGVLVGAPLPVPRAVARPPHRDKFPAQRKMNPFRRAQQARPRTKKKRASPSPGTAHASPPVTP